MAERFQIYNKNLQALGSDLQPLSPSKKLLDLKTGVFNRLDDALNQWVEGIDWAYNSEGKIIGMKVLEDPNILTQARGIVHKEGDWHLSAHFWAYSIDEDNGKKTAKLAVQLRWPKDVYWDTFDATAAWHIDHEGDKSKWEPRDSSTADTILRETKEEIGLQGITLDDLKFVGIETYAMNIMKDGEVVKKNNEHKFVYFHKLPPGSLTRNEENKEYIGPLFTLNNGDQSDQIEAWKEVLAPEVAGIKVFTLEELETELIMEEQRVKNGEKERFMPPLNYWHRVIKEIRKEISPQ